MRSTPMFSLILAALLATIAGAAAIPGTTTPVAANKIPESMRLPAGIANRDLLAAIRRAFTDVVAVTELAVIPSNTTSRTVRITIKNTGSAPLSSVGWQILLHSGGYETVLGCDAASDMAAGATASFSATYSRTESNISIEALVDPDRKLETGTAIRANNSKVLAVPGSMPGAGLKVVAMDVTSALASGASNSYTPWTGTAGCSMIAAPVGLNALAVNANCTGAGGLYLQLLDTFTLKNGWKVDGIQAGVLGSNPFTYVHVPLAGTTATKVVLSVPSGTNSTLIAVSVDIVGPSNTSPY